MTVEETVRVAARDTLSTAVELMHRVERFLALEARLLDTHAYDDWEALWADDGIYWIPANGSDIDPEREMSIVYDNRSRIGIRVAQLKTGRRHTQMPRSEIVHFVSNVEVLGMTGDEITVAANVLIVEVGLHGEITWAARTEYRLRDVGDGFRLARKKVALVNGHKPIFTLSFLV